MKVGIYFTAGKPDAAIVRGLIEAGCDTQVTSTITETHAALQHLGTKLRSLRTLRKRRTYDLMTPILIADVQSGAIALLDILQEQKIELPPTLLVDNAGCDIQVPLRALQHGVKEYVLPDDDADKRECLAKQLVERALALARQPSAPSPVVVRNGISPPQRTAYLSSIDQLQWDPVSLTIQINDEDFLRLSPMEGRTFDLLYARRGDTVSIDELIEITLAEKDGNASKNIQLLRTHLARLRRRLADHPRFGYRIENMRGSGYTLI